MILLPNLNYRVGRSNDNPLFGRDRMEELNHNEERLMALCYQTCSKLIINSLSVNIITVIRECFLQDNYKKN